MDKILAFSILSSSPADLAAATGSFSTRLSWRTSGATAKAQQQAEKAPAKQEKAQQQGSSSLPEPRKPEPRARFAPEFDGLNCFESIVSF